MKRLINKLIILLIICGIVGAASLPVYAHGVIYEQKKVGENTLRVTLKWSDPGNNKSIVVRSYVVRQGKYIDIAYEIMDNAHGKNTKDFDLRTLLEPLSVRLYDISDYEKPIFPDLKAHYAESYVHHLHDAGVISGRPDGNYGPNDRISRAEFVTLMVRALKLEGSTENKKGFTDINTHWAKNNILVSANHGLISGYTDKTFKPENPVTIAEASAIIARAFTFKTTKNGIYDKLKPDMWYSDYVKKLFDAGVMGVNDKIYEKFNEQDYINRADCAMLISRALSTY